MSSLSTAHMPCQLGL